MTETQKNTTDKAAERNERRVHEMAELVDSYAALLEEENAALKAHDIEKVSELLEHKQKVGRLYEQNVALIAEKPEILAGIDEKLRSSLKTKAEALQKLMKKNEHLLKSNAAVSQKILEAFVRAAKEMEAKNASYSADGKLGPATKGRQAAFSYNETL